MNKIYSLRKSHKILQHSYQLYRKKGQKLTDSTSSLMENDLIELEKAVKNREREKASILAHQLEKFCDEHFKKNYRDYFKEVVIAIILALSIAIVVRQTWFELYEIPTGSMRPTFREQDHLTVSKTTFGLNVPLETKHFYFDPNLVQRTSVLIFSGHNIPLPDTDAPYFGIIPYKKRYIKRSIGLPGDTLYFYGGKIYGIDKSGHEIKDFDNQWMKDLEHIPFLSFEERSYANVSSEIKVFFKLINQTIAKATITNYGTITGEILSHKDWIADKPDEEDNKKIHTYSDFYGMHNFAMARLLTKQQVTALHPDVPLNEMEEGELYLELRHHPSLSYPAPQLVKSNYGISLMLTPQVSIVPLQQKHLDAIMDSMYTARFVVDQGYARRYSAEDNHKKSSQLAFPNVPNGTYEFYHGKAHSIGWGGIPYQVESNASLYSHDPDYIQKLYNLGIEFDTFYEPSPQNQIAFPHRYAYFRDGDLYLLGAPILKIDDPILKNFNQREAKKAENAKKDQPYLAFKDYGPPLKDGNIDKDFINAFGIHIPEKQYMVLGDNHAMSSDSRIFGFVPEDNLQGAPSLIIWPPGDRWGFPSQKPYPFMNLSRAFVWGLAALISLVWYSVRQRQLRKPIVLHKAKPKA